MILMRTIFFLSLVTSLASCTTVPITGRQQLSLIPSSTLITTSYRQYDTFLKENKLSTDVQKVAMVRRVGERIQSAVERYFDQMGMASELKDYRWDFKLVESQEMNAWCMPGGKVVVYTGILPVTRDETGLAVVMGHEIAHAIAEHGSERMTQSLLAELGGMGIAAAMESKPEQTKKLWMSAFGVGTQVGILLPYSRLQENEADRLGLDFMAMAGYDPREAVAFWERMAKSAVGKKPPEFLSSHPSDDARISRIRQFIPEAMKYYDKAGR